MGILSAKLSAGSNSLEFSCVHRRVFGWDGAGFEVLTAVVEEGLIGCRRDRQVTSCSRIVLI